MAAGVVATDGVVAGVVAAGGVAGVVVAGGVAGLVSAGFAGAAGAQAGSTSAMTSMTMIEMNNTFFTALHISFYFVFYAVRNTGVIYLNTPITR